MINLNHLKIFYYTAKNQSVTRAARDLYITQPAVTAQLKKFEEQLKLKLFKKRGRKIYPTAESEILYEYAKRVFDTAVEFENAVEEMQGLKRGVLRLGAAKTYARYLLPFLIRRFLHDYPNIKIKVDEGSSQELISSLLEFKNELAIIVKTEENKEIQFVPFFREELVLILATDHSLTRRKTVCFSDLCKEKIMMKEIGSGTRKLVDDLFAKHQCSPNILMETSNSEFIKQLVQQGEGISFLSKESVLAELSENKLASVSIKDCAMPMDAYIAYMANQHISVVGKAFIKYIENLKPKNQPLHKISDLKAKIVDGGS